MKRLSIFLVFLCVLSFGISAQTVIPEEAGIDNSAVLKVTSPTNSKGVLFPTLTNLEMLSIQSPAEGLIVYNTDENAFMYFSTQGWQHITYIESTGSNATAGIVEGEIRFYTGDNSIMFLNGAAQWRKITVSGNTITP